MLALSKPPDWLTNNVPEGARDFLQGGGWWAVLGAGGLLALLLLWLTVGRLVRGLFRREAPPPPKDDLREDLAAIPAPPAGTADRKLTIEGVPVRLRLVVVAPAGTAYDLKPDAIPKLLDRVLPGLEAIVKRDQPRTRIWPKQLSTEGFANTFHRHTPVPEGENAPTRWILVSGRADVGGRQVFVGLGLQAISPTTVGRLRLDTHEWATTLRIRVLE